MNYRRLTVEELENLREDFVRFLAAHQISAFDWEKMKTDESEKADAFLDQFSEGVFDSILKKVEYLEFKTPQDIKTFHCLPDKIKLLGLMVEGGSEVDFTGDQSAGDMLGILQKSGASLKMYSAEKAYGGRREQELFRMLEQGCLISKDGEMYKLLNSVSR